MQPDINSTPQVNNGDCNGCAVDLSKAETEVYDRQIRLWGIEAQKKLHVASGLVCGLCGVGAEIAKNLMLCGLRSLTLMDDKLVSRSDLDSNFLLNEDSIGKNRAKASSVKAQSLNPMVNLKVVESSITSISPDFISQFTLVVLCDQPYDVVVMWNDICRQLNIRFIACGVFGWMGYSFFDFNNHLFISPVVKKKKGVWLGENGDGTSTAETTVDVDAEHDLFEERVMQYPRFEDAFNVDWSKKQLIRKSKRLIPFSYFPLKAMLRAQKENLLTDNEDINISVLVKLWTEEVLFGNHDIGKQSVQPEQFDYFFGPQLSPVCAIVGGFVGQEAIKALSENGRPLKNIFIYSALDSTGTICDFPPSD